MAGKADADERQRQALQVERVLSDSGRPAHEVMEDLMAPDPPPDRSRQFRGVNLSRMRRTWHPDEQIIMSEISRQAEEAIMKRFLAAFDVMDQIFTLVRTPLTQDGEVVNDATGRPLWEVNDLGLPVEDWTRLGDRERIRFLYVITTHLFEWEQSAADQWGLAMYAKGIWEERFARAYGELEGRQTVDDRTQYAHRTSMEDRYFGIFQSVLSRRADALIRSMTRIEQRLKDTMQL